MANPNAEINGRKTRFKPGNKAGKGNGRPKGPDLGKLIRDQAVEIVEDDKGDKMERLELLIRNLWQMAMDGNMKAVEILFDRAFGKVTDRISFEGEDGSLAAAIAVPMVYYSSMAEMESDCPGFIRREVS